MPLRFPGNGIPLQRGRGACSCLCDQLVDPSAVKSDDHLTVDDDGGCAAAVIGAHELFQGCWILGDIAFNEVDPFLRKILFRCVAGASAIGGKEFDLLLGHDASSSCDQSWLRTTVC